MDTITLRPPNWMPVVLLVAIVIGGGFYVAGKKIEAQDHTPTTIDVTGEGKASAVPDIAELSFGFTVSHVATAKAAMDTLGKNMQAVFDAVKKAGVDEKDIQTQELNLNQAFDWSTGKQTLLGYDATQNLTVKVRNMDSVSDVLAAATNAGANQVGGVTFTVDDPEKARAAARAYAIAQAQQKAQVLADQLHMHLGRVRNFSEGGGIQPPLPMMAGAAMEKSADVAPTPLPAGQQETDVQVNLTYELQ